jgi:hypothetical protein
VVISVITQIQWWKKERYLAPSFLQLIGCHTSTFWVVGLIGTGVSTIAFLGYVLWDYFEDVKAISRMIEAVKKGKSLPELEKLSRKSVPE